MITTPNKTNSVQWLQEQMDACPPYPGGFEGRGIIYIAGGNKYWTNAYCSIRLLREKGCRLPIECYYLGKQEENETIQSLLSQYDVRCIDIRALNDSLPKQIQHTNLNGWEAKAFAMLHTEFKHVLYLDADVFVDGDPESIFDSTEYNTFGSIFMPDFGRLGPDREIWSVCGLDWRDEAEVESGIIFCDKERCWNSLNICNKMCEWGVRFFWHYIHGDKCSWQLAWHLCNQQYYQIPTPISRLSGTMVQHDTTGKKMFFHRNMRKLDIKHNQRINGFANEDKLFGYLEELRLQWDPFSISETDVDKLDTQALAGSTFDYVRMGLDSRVMVFGKEGAITTGSASMEKAYSMRNGVLHLLDTNGSVTAKLERTSVAWIGRWDHHERCVVLLIERRPL